MASVYSVGQVNAYIKHMFEQDFALNNIYIRGEVSNCKYHTSGHIYFTLKDAGAVLACVMFAGNRKNLTFKLEEGMKVTAYGSVNVYERDGKYQLYVSKMQQDGQGDLYRRFEELKAELLEMGMFDASYKKPIPKYATRIGIVTASTGAAIQDIINISMRRNPHVQLYLYPAIVQGAEAAPSIVRGIQKLDTMGLDVIIVGRGGGSLEDLWAFNEEIVARAIFNAETPIISAVGHETDTTIADYVSDLRAPTPSAAAELAVFDYEAYMAELRGYEDMLSRQMRVKVDRLRAKVANYELRVKHASPFTRIANKRQNIDDIMVKLQDRLARKLERKRHKLAMATQKLQGLSPLNKIGKGYGYIEGTDGAALSSVKQVAPQDVIQVSLQDGKLSAVVTEVTEREAVADQRD